MIVDIYTHIMPQAFFTRWLDLTVGMENMGKRMRNMPDLQDLDARFRTMDIVQDDYRQIISLPNPPLEEFTEPDVGAEMARIGNDTMAELVAKYPDRFPAFVASMAMHDLDGAIREAERALDQLGAKGLQIYTHVAGKALDAEQFQPIFALAAERDLPIWVHPTRQAAVSDYLEEDRSFYEMWWCFGWPYDTSVAMARLVFSGLFDRHPDIKIITHHCGGMIPYFEGRIDRGMQRLGARTTTEDYSQVLSSLKRPHGEYFKLFYGDTAMFGATGGIKCGIEYFGIDNVVFATDAPFAPMEESIAVIDQLGLDDEGKKTMCLRNAERLMNMSFD